MKKSELKDLSKTLEIENDRLKKQLSILILNISKTGEIENLDYPDLTKIDWSKIDIGVQFLRCRVKDKNSRTLKNFNELPKLPPQ